MRYRCMHRDPRAASFARWAASTTRCRLPTTTSICVFGCDPPAGASSGHLRLSLCIANRHRSAGTTRVRALTQFARDVALMRQRWGPLLQADPFYNRNLSLKEVYRLSFPPRPRQIGSELPKECTK